MAASSLPRHWTWHFRLVRQEDGSFDVYEIYQDRRGNLKAYKDEPVPAVGRDDPENLDLALFYESSLKSARKLPIVEHGELAKLQVLQTYFDDDDDSPDGGEPRER